MLGCINATPFDHFFKPSDPLVFDIPRASLNWSDPSEKRLSADFIEQLIATMLGSKHIRFKCCSFCGFPPKTLLLRKCNVEGNGVATLHVVPGFEMWTRKVMQELVDVQGRAITVKDMNGDDDPSAAVSVAAPGAPEMNAV